MSEISTCDRCGLTSAHTLGCLMEQLAIERNTVAEAAGDGTHDPSS